MAKLAAAAPINKIAEIAAITAEQSAKSAQKEVLNLKNPTNFPNLSVNIARKTRNVTKIGLSQLQLF